MSDGDDDVCEFYMPRPQLSPWDDAHRQDESPGDKARESATPTEPPVGPNRASSRRSDEDITLTENIPSDAASHQAEVSPASPRDTSQSKSKSESTTTKRRGRRLSVHAFGQFEFCARAGIYAHEQPNEQDVDEPLPRLGYLPNFDVEKIEERLRAELNLVGVLLLACGALIFGFHLGANRYAVYRVILSLGFASAVGLLVVSCYRVLRLLARRTAARWMPEVDLRQLGVRVTAVSWWSLLRAGCEPMVFLRPLLHPTLPLEGNPWRVLVWGSWRIPVIRTGGRRLGPTRDTVYKKHELRLAAYAEMLEATPHVEVPFGLVFTADSHRGLCVPLTLDVRERLARRFERAMVLIDSSQIQQCDPRLPDDRTRCANCELGKPQPISDEEIKLARRNGRRLLVLADVPGAKFHCECGDRFDSIPPHQETLARRLRASHE
ncbi:MAG: hypothetical protein KDA92_20395 [Planctomycetales bacterium]|nr:hypothetical protein [Planctomycetales bacterium]